MNRRRLIFSAGPVAVAAGLGGLGARQAPQTYRRLDKPSWAPPAAAFGPVWSALYVAIGAAGWRVFAGASRRTAALHLTQLALNGAWPIAFFRIRDKRASLIIIALLDGGTDRRDSDAAPRRSGRGGLLVPYLAWTGFATALNAAVNDPGEHP